MNPDDLLTELERLDIKMSLTEDKLRVDAPAGVLTPYLKAALRQHKPALVLLLRTKPEYGMATRLLREQGWVAIRSRALGGEVVIWTKDGTVAVPARWMHAVRYTLAELLALANPPVLSPEELRQIHEGKRIFNGRIEGNPD